MVKVKLIDRKSNTLTPSSLRCLSHLPTINVTAGCAHGCAYCYIRGYSQYPGDGEVAVYHNTAVKVEQELKRKLPAAVYFCPSSDAFMPVDEVLEQSYRTMQILLDKGVQVQFVTKGLIPDRFMELFSLYPKMVAGQVGLTSVNNELNAAIEPHVPSAVQRLDTLESLIGIGVTASLRADPLIHGLTDSDDDISSLFAAAVKRNVKEVSASYLFLRPGIVGSLKRNIADEDLLQKILIPFKTSGKLSFQRNSSAGGLSLPLEVRRSGLLRIKNIAEQHGLSLRICGCKNSDITNGKCHLTNLAVIPDSRTGKSQQAGLWECT